MRQNMGLDGGYGVGPHNNTSRRFKNGQEVKMRMHIVTVSNDFM